ncbi:MAG: outer membrane beta-barrel protein [Bryobacteraceae bacterium]
MRYWIMLLLFCMPAAAGEPIKFGVKVGVPVTDLFEPVSGGRPSQFLSSSAKTKRYAVGLSAAIKLRHRIGFEIDGLYRRVNYDLYSRSSISSGDGGTIYSWSGVTGNRLDFPLLFRWSPLRPLYVVAGPTFAVHYGFNQRIHRIQDLTLSGFSEQDLETSEISELGGRLSQAVTLGMGLDIPTGGVHVRPEVRYFHWIRQAFNTDYYFKPKADEVTIFLGLEFGGKR